MTLENKVGQGKPSLKQWIPVWGIYQTYKDHKEGKQIRFEPNLPMTFKEFGFVFYHALIISAGIVTPLEYLFP